jgi:hypothetical protein
MPFDELDKKIIEAADHHHPAYDEQAWEKMKKKLDKHLPEKKDDRRRLFFLLLGLLFLTGGAFFVYINSGRNDKKENLDSSTAVTKINSTPEKLQKGELPATLPGEVAAADPVNRKKIATNPVGSETSEKIVYNKQADKKIAINKFAEYRPGDLTKKEEAASLKLSPRGSMKTAVRKRNAPSVVVDNIVAAQKDNRLLVRENNISNKESTETEIIKSKEASSDVKAVRETNKTAEEISKKENQDSTAKGITVNKIAAPEKENEKQKKKGSFILTLSTGIDVSAVDIKKIGTAAIQYGGGIGYNFANGITLRTGFFAGKKLYSADSADYNAPAGWWQYYPGLKNIKADCKVYEIPLFVSYKFKSVKNHSWFVSTGISSVIMKRETYDYLYKGAWGQYQTTQRTIKNQNKHLFSVLTLSGGYTYNLNKRIAFSAEPYFKMPLTGIGFGKIKLKSTGMLFSMSVKPFSKK